VTVTIYGLLSPYLIIRGILDFEKMGIMADEVQFDDDVAVNPANHLTALRKQGWANTWLPRNS
jgi:hypothetical protein